MSYWHHRRLITPAQCRAAKAALNLGYRELAAEVGTTTDTLLAYFKHERTVYPPIIERVRAVFEARGLRFYFGRRSGLPTLRLLAEESDRVRIFRPLHARARRQSAVTADRHGTVQRDTGQVSSRPPRYARTG